MWLTVRNDPRRRGYLHDSYFTPGYSDARVTGCVTNVLSSDGARDARMGPEGPPWTPTSKMVSGVMVGLVEGLHGPLGFGTGR